MTEKKEENGNKSPSNGKKSEGKTASGMPIPDMHSVGGVLVHMPHVSKVNETNNPLLNLLLP